MTEWDKVEAELTDDAEVVDLTAARAGRRDGSASTSDGTDLDDGTAPDDYTDRESVEIARRVLGAPVDPPDEPLPVNGRRRIKRAIVPPALRTRSAAVAAGKNVARDAGYVVGYHATRSPKYAVKTTWYALVGLFRGTGRLVGWATAERHNFDLRQRAAERGDPEVWLKLDRQRQKQSRWRWTLVIAAALLSMVALA
ncbi:MAG: cell division protein FtsK, partial [Stackebrandtia sp.]